jgi:hypothetical protein
VLQLHCHEVSQHAFPALDSRLSTLFAVRSRLFFCSELTHPIATTKNNNLPKAICMMARYSIACHCLTSAPATANQKMLLRAAPRLTPHARLTLLLAPASRRLRSRLFSPHLTTGMWVKCPKITALEKNGFHPVPFPEGVSHGSCTCTSFRERALAAARRIDYCRHWE